MVYLTNNGGEARLPMRHTNKQGSFLYNQQQAGYSIIEVMLFLAISSILAVSILTGLSGQQRRTEFNQSTREAESKLNDVMNDFVTGFSPLTSVGCSAGAAGGAPVLSGTTSGQGVNFGCAFIGKVVQFSPDGNPENIRIFNVVGRQFMPGSTIDPVTNIVEARPVVLPSSIENTSFGNGLRLQELTITNSVTQPIGAVGFFSSFASTSPGATGNEYASGRQITTVIGIPGSSLGLSEADMIAAIEAIPSYGGGSYVQLSNDYINKPIHLCLLGGDGTQHATIDIGDNQNRTATKLTIKSGGSCT